MEIKLDGNYTRILCATLNKFWKQHPTKQKLYGHLPPITKVIQVRRTRHAGHCWRIPIPQFLMLWWPAMKAGSTGMTQRQSTQWKHADPPRTQEGQANPPINFKSFYWQHWHDHWVPTGQTVNKEYYVEVLKKFRKRFRRKRSALFKSGQWHFHQDNAPVHNSILVTYYFIKMDIKTVSQPPYSLDLSPCDFWLFPKLKKKLRGCRYETIEEMKEAVTKVTDTLTQEDFH